MTTNIIEILLKIKQDGAEIIENLNTSFSSLRKTMEEGSAQNAFLEELGKGLKAAGAGAKETEEALKQLKAASASPLSSSYAQGFLEAMKSTDKAALEAKLSLESVKATLAKGGGDAAFITGMMDALHKTSTEADIARASIQKLSGVNVDALRGSLDGVSDALKKVGEGSALANVNSALKGTETGVIGLIGWVKGLAGAFAALAVVKYMLDAVQVAARVEVLGTVLHQIGKNAGYTREELDKADRAVQKMGITASSSRESLTQLMNAGLKIDLAAPLARASQDLAVITGQNSSETFQRLIVNISQLDAMGLRWMGIMLNRTEGEIKYAQSIGKTVDQLTAKEQKEAFANEVLVQAAKNTGLYEASMTNAGKQAASLARYQETLGETIGNYLLPAYSAAVEQFTLFLKEMIKATTGSDDAAVAGKKLGEAIAVIGEALRGVASFLIEHKEIIAGIAVAWGTIKVAGFISSLSIVGGSVTTLSFLIGGLLTLLGNVFSGSVLEAAGTLVTKVGFLQAALRALHSVGLALMGVFETIASFFLTKLVTAFPVLETLAIRFMYLVGPIGMVAAALLSLWAIWESGKAYFDMREAEAGLVKIQESAKAALAKLGPDAKENWDKFKKAGVDAVGDIDKDKAQIQKKMEDLAKAIEYGSRRYAVAMAAGKDATEEDKKAIAEYEEVVVKKLLPAMEGLSRARAAASAPPPPDQDAVNFSKKRADIADLVSSYKSAIEAVKDFQSQVSKGVDVAYSTANKAIVADYRMEQSTLVALGVEHKGIRGDMIRNDEKFFQVSSALAREEHRVKQAFLKSNMESMQAVYSAEIEIAMGTKEGSGELIKAQMQARQAYTVESLALAQREHDTLVSLRDQAHSKMVEQMRAIADLKRQAMQEDISHQVKVADLTMRLAFDGFAARERSISDKEAALTQRERAAQASGNQAELGAVRSAREALSEEREAIVRDRRQAEESIKAQGQSKFEEWAAKAREELAKGSAANLLLASEYEKSANHYASASGKVSDQLANENTLHSLKATAIAEGTRRAEEARVKEEEAFKAIASAVNESAKAVKDLTSQLIQLGLENQIFTYQARFDAMQTKIEEAREKMSKWSTSKADAAAFEASILRMEKAQGELTNAIGKTRNALDIFQEQRKLTIDTTDIDRITAKSDKAVESVSKIGPTASKGFGEMSRATSVANQGVINMSDSVSRALEILANPTSLKIDVDRANNTLHELNSNWIKSFQEFEAKELKVKLDAAEAIQKLERVGFSHEEAKQAIARGAGTIKVVDDASNVITSIRDSVNSLGEKTQIITLIAEDGQVLSVIEKLATDNHVVNFNAELNASEVESQLDAIEQEPVVVSVFADDQTALNDIAALDASQPKVDTEVTSNAAAVAEDLSALERPLHTEGHVTTDVWPALSALGRIPRDIYTTHHVRTVHEGATGGMISFGGFRHFAEGGLNSFTPRSPGLVSGPGTGTSDSIPALIANGEYLLRAAAVKHYGVDFLSSLNQMLLPTAPVHRFAEGGLVDGGARRPPRSVASISTQATAAVKRDSMDINFKMGGGSYTVQSSRDTARQLSAALRGLARAV